MMGAAGRLAKAVEGASQVSGPKSNFVGLAEGQPLRGNDELLARIDKYLASFGRIYESGPSLSESLLRDCRTRIAANAALAARCERLQAAIDDIASATLDEGGRFATYDWQKVRALASQAEGER